LKAWNLGKELRWLLPDSSPQNLPLPAWSRFYMFFYLHLETNKISFNQTYNLGII